jgi:GH24 family phage-related lysozyme (muramidase)
MLNFLGEDDFVWWTGVVEDVEDPLKVGRIRVRIFGYHSEDKTDIPTDKLPWASPIMPISSASIGGIGTSPTGVTKKSWVMGFFRDGYNAQDPIVWGTVPGRKNDGSEGQNNNGRGKSVPPTLQNYSAAKAAGRSTNGLGVTEDDSLIKPLSTTQKNLAVSTDLKSFIKKKEGFSANAYSDHKQYSIGYGTKAKYAGEVIDRVEADRRLDSNIAIYRAEVIKRKEKYGYDWDDKQVDALTSFAYNGGPGWIDQVTADGTRDNETIAQKMLLYNKASGKTIDALVTRRQEESAMFSAGGVGDSTSAGNAQALSPTTKSDQIQQREDNSPNTPEAQIAQNAAAGVSSPNPSTSGSSSTNSSGQNSQSDLPERSTTQKEPQTEEHESKELLTENEKFKEPKSPYAATYPNNTVTKSRTGHMIEIDDTPGAERLHTYHRSGSFEEYHPDGKKVNKTMKDLYDIVHGNKKIHVKGNLTLVVDGNYNIVVGKKSTTGVGKELDVKAGGNMTFKAPKIDLNP